MHWKILGVSTMMILVLSCSKDSCPLSSGNTNSEMRELPIFREIILYDKINLILMADSIQKIRVETGKNLLPGISTIVDGGKLTIQDNNGCKLLRTDASTVNVYISTGTLEKITYHGAGDVGSTDTIRQNHFTVDCVDGSGSINLKLIADSVDAIIRTRNADISFSGYGNYSSIYCAAEGSINLSHFITRVAYIQSTSIRDIHVNVTGNLYASILYLGNVYYTGNPVYIQSTITSSGKLIQLP